MLLLYECLVLSFLRTLVLQEHRSSLPAALLSNPLLRLLI